MAVPTAETVAECLCDRATRSVTLTALESHPAPIPTMVSLAAAPALLRLMAMDAAEVERDTYDRVGLLLARLYVEALPDVLAVHGAAFGDGGYERQWNADSVLNTALRQPADQLTRADAVSYACNLAYDSIILARGATEAWSAAGLTVMEFVRLWLSTEPMISKKKVPEDDVPTKMVTLMVELLKANEFPELAIGGAWSGVVFCIIGRPSIGPVAFERGVVELAVEHLKAIGSPVDWVSISRGKGGRAGIAMRAVSEMCKQFADKVSRPDLTACVASGLFDLCIEAITAVAAGDVDGLQDTHHSTLYYALSLVQVCRREPGCEDKIRSAADALAFCLMHDLDYAFDLGATSGAMAASLCENPCAALCSRESHTQSALVVTLNDAYSVRAGCGVFGRDEGGSDFSFSAQHIEAL